MMIPAIIKINAIADIPPTASSDFLTFSLFSGDVTFSLYHLNSSASIRASFIHRLNFSLGNKWVLSFFILLAVEKA